MWEIRCHGCQHISNGLIFSGFLWQPRAKSIVSGCQKKRIWQPLTTKNRGACHNNSLNLRCLLPFWQPWQRKYIPFGFWPNLGANVLSISSENTIYMSFRRPKGGRISCTSTLCSRDSSLTLWMTNVLEILLSLNLVRTPFCFSSSFPSAEESVQICLRDFFISWRRFYKNCRCFFLLQELKFLLQLMLGNLYKNESSIGT